MNQHLIALTKSVLGDTDPAIIQAVATNPFVERASKKGMPALIEVIREKADMERTMSKLPDALKLLGVNEAQLLEMLVNRNGARKPVKKASGKRHPAHPLNSLDEKDFSKFAKDFEEARVKGESPDDALERLCKAKGMPSVTASQFNTIKHRKMKK